MSKHRQNATQRRFSFSLSDFLAVVFVLVYLVAFFRIALPNQLASGESQPMRRLELLTLLTVPDALGSVFHQDHAPGWLRDRLEILSLAAGYLVMAAALGSVLLRWLRPKVAESRIEQWVFTLGLGLSGLSLATFLLGVFGLLHRGLFLAVAVAIGIAFGLGRYQSSKLNDPPPEKTLATEGSGLSAHWLWILLPLALLLLNGAVMPPMDFDVREYHLQAPKEFFQNSRIGFVPHNVYANMPLGAEMHALAAMVVTQDWFVGALVGKTVIASFALLTTAAIYSFGCRFFSRSAGVISAIVYLSTPWVLLVSSQGLIDGVVGCYALLSIYALALWRRSIAEGDASVAMRRLILCGLMAGSAVACKYPAMVFVALPIVGYVAAYRVIPLDRRSRLCAVAVVVAAMAAPCGPWFAKNWILAGNPTYPLLYSVFGGKTRTPEKDVQWRRAHAPPNFAPSDFANRADGAFLTSEWIGPAMAPLAILGVATALLRRRTDATDGRAIFVLQLVGYCAVFFLLWWLLTHRIDRFLVPLLPVAAIIGGCTILRSARGRFVSLAMCGIAVLYAVSISLFILMTPNFGGQLFNPLAWYAFPSQRIKLPQDTRLLVVGDAQGFGYTHPILYNTCFDDCILEQLIAGKIPTDARKALHDAKISQIFVNWDEIERYRSPGNYGYSSFPTRQRFAELVDDGVLKAVPEFARSQKSHYGLFEVMD